MKTSRSGADTKSVMYTVLLKPTMSSTHCCCCNYELCTQMLKHLREISALPANAKCMLYKYLQIPTVSSTRACWRRKWVVRIPAEIYYAWYTLSKPQCVPVDKVCKGHSVLWSTALHYEAIQQCKQSSGFGTCVWQALEPSKNFCTTTKDQDFWKMLASFYHKQLPSRLSGHFGCLFFLLFWQVCRGWLSHHSL